MKKNLKTRFEWLCENHRNFTDQQFADYLEFSSTLISPNVEFHSIRLNEIIVARVEKYCQGKQIAMVDYDGPLPYRKFVVEI